ncbi:MAG TPA: glutamine-hydrolyzing carbamoyl-phosphate synthase small subunit [Methanothrix sp.]|nr:glutamine-hydrolyzing carbamoyl-phosphate synthase small subunit [Methanothrix sp.]
MYLGDLAACHADTMIGVLGLEDGTRVEGTGFGASGVALGELVFTTVMSGYEEALTDPSYHGQMLMFTYPLQGNYGISGDDFQSERMWPQAMVSRGYWDRPTHYQHKKTLSQFLKDEGRPGLCGVDTRMLTLKVREQGVMRAAIAVGERSEVEELDVVAMARSQPDISSRDLLGDVSCRAAYRIEGRGPRLAVIDLGIKKNILRSLACRDFDMTVFPSHSSISEIEAARPDALFLSNGPGDPERAEKAIEAVKHFAGAMPIFGICLGHQVISLALGARTFKLKFGHHGGNQPVKDLEKKIVYITSQNHNFAVRPESVQDTDLVVTQLNANDGTVEAVKSDKLQVLAVQYHPEANPGPLCTEDPFFGSVQRMMKSAARKAGRR